MAKPAQNNFAQNPSSRLHEITQDIVSKGNKISYLRKALYPVLEVKTLIREKSRDQMGDLEKYVLRIIGESVFYQDDIAKLLGFKEAKLGPILKELEGRGLIEGHSDNRYISTELGKLSLDQGAAVFEVERALLLCGITGQLLPRELYNLPRMSTSQVPRAVFGREFIDGAPNIPLTGLSLNRIKDKRKVNLPDEAVEILGVVDTRPYFLEGVLALYINSSGNEFAEISFGRTSVDWLTTKQVMPIIEPLGYSAGMTTEQVKQSISDELRAIGATLTGTVTLDGLQNLRVGIKAIDNTFHNCRYGNKSLSMYVGTRTNPPVPIGCFPMPQKKPTNTEASTPPKRDLLFGRILSLVAEDNELIKVIDVLRTCDEIIIAHSRLPLPEKKQTKPQEYALGRLAERGIDVAEVRRCLAIAPDAKLSKIFGVQDEAINDAE